MSRALLLIAQARFLKRPLTPEETDECLKIWRELAGGLRVYVPNNAMSIEAHAEEILSLRAQGKTLEEIGKHFGVSRETIRQALQIFGAETCTEPA